MIFFQICLINIFIAGISGDVYMHNPRGSSDRNCERNVNRNNENRLFNSQNNAAGGYACPRAVGTESFQSEMGIATFNIIDTVTAGTTSNFTQNKRMYYYEGSILPIEWTNQHGCGSNSKVSCEIILQYACEDTLDPQVDNFWPWVPDKAGNTTAFYGKQHFRSGQNIAAPRDGVPTSADDAATDTITDSAAAAIPDTAADRRFGMQESYDYYKLCQYTERNKGLYTADQWVRRNDRRGTRQNPNGNRHGFECPEERDYYPWWAPSPWIDIAVLTDSAVAGEICYPTSKNCSLRCNYYMNNTMNFQSKGYCDVDHNYAPLSKKLNHKYWTGQKWFNNKLACQNAGFKWYNIKHSDNLNLDVNSFVCAKTQFARINHLGNSRADSVISQSSLKAKGVLKDHAVQGLNANRFLWQIPKIPTPKLNPTTKYFYSMTSAYRSCVVRIRYNISTGDFQQWPKQAVGSNVDKMVDYTNNSKSASSIDPNTPLTQDPYVYISPGESVAKGEQFLSLAINTNQYGRTFQDRSYVFTIKPFPTQSISSNTQRDIPKLNATALAAAINAGGKIYNVNVRGKRGNIVQVYPSVEYDFAPNALALGVHDVIHFQWTGSDYNPRRGCNNAEGGPPDPNTFSTSANANLNSRADRSNVVFQYYMSMNEPRDYLGYDRTSTTLDFAGKTLTSMNAVLENAPCYNPATDSAQTATDCYNTIMRLAYLNQQSDGGSFSLRGGATCLTVAQLNAITDTETAENHPLNCAKLNAKPYPYFDGGIMFMRNSGWFPFFSSRNNNFSNRNQGGIICIGSACKIDSSTGVLQGTNPETTGTEIVKRTSTSTCKDTANTGTGANNFGATSCIPVSSATAATSILTVESFTKTEGDNDNKGSGNYKGCEIITFTFSDSNTIQQQLALAFILLAVGLVFSWLAYFLYNRIQARRKGDSKFRGETGWTEDSRKCSTCCSCFSTTTKTNQMI